MTGWFMIDHFILDKKEAISRTIATKGSFKYCLPLLQLYDSVSHWIRKLVYDPAMYFSVLLDKFVWLVRMLYFFFFFHLVFDLSLNTHLSVPSLPNDSGWSISMTCAFLYLLPGEIHFQGELQDRKLPLMLREGSWELTS